MQAHTLSSNSWHFWLANWGSIRVRQDEQVDICSYIRKVIAGTFNMIGVGIVSSILIGGFLLCMGSMAYWVYSCISQLTWITPQPQDLLGMAVVIAVGIAFAKERFEQYMDERALRKSIEKMDDVMFHKEREPGFMSLAYRKFKSKTCFKLQFKQD